MNTPSQDSAPASPIVILINGPSSSGKSTLCRALQDHFADLATGDSDAIFARVAFDDFLLLMSDKLYPISFVGLRGGDTSRLVSEVPHDGRAGWEYVEESEIAAEPDGKPRLRLELSPGARRLLRGAHRSWGAHLDLGTNLIIDHFLQEKEWCEEVTAILRDTGARIFMVGVFCSVDELERRESSRGDGGVEGRPLGLARRSSELCHAHDLDYDVTIRTDKQTTSESVDAILTALGEAGFLRY